MRSNLCTSPFEKCAHLSIYPTQLNCGVFTLHYHIISSNSQYINYQTQNCGAIMLLPNERIKIQIPTTPANQLSSDINICIFVYTKKNNIY